MVQFFQMCTTGNRENVIQRITTEPDSAGRSRVVPINLSEENAYGIEFNLSLNIQDWWKLNSSANFYRAMTHGVYEGDDLGERYLHLDVQDNIKNDFC
jgi:outer membrane receptor protein involved in Fe transport